MDTEYSKFKAREVASWGKYTKTLPPVEYLVKPSGALTSPISHRLNEPSLRVNIAENGETADLTNPCIAMAIGTASTDDVLVYDQIHRREENSNGSAQYPSGVLQAHADWTEQILESSEAKVEVVYGKKAQTPILANKAHTPLPLWGEFEGVLLLLLEESNFRNAQEGYRFRKVIVCVAHPQHLFYQTAGSHRLWEQERSTSVAAAKKSRNKIHT
jgi:hypothetical protein